MPKPIKRVALFSAGCHTDNRGVKRCYTRADLDAMASGVSDPIPHVITHKEMYSPFSFARSSRVWREGDVLYADAEAPESNFAKMVKDGRLYSRSIRVAHTDKGPRIQHIAWLGAEPPAVEGLPPVEYAAAGGQLADYSEPESSEASGTGDSASGGDDGAAGSDDSGQAPTPSPSPAGGGEQEGGASGEDALRGELEAMKRRTQALEERLARQDADATRQEFARWVDGQLQARRITPAEAEGMVQELAALAGASDYAAGDGRLLSPLETYKARVEGRAPMAGGISQGTDPGRESAGASAYAAPAGYSYDAGDADMVRRVRDYAKQHDLEFVAAYKQMVEEEMGA